MVTGIKDVAEQFAKTNRQSTASASQPIGRSDGHMTPDEHGQVAAARIRMMSSAYMDGENTGPKALEDLTNVILGETIRQVESQAAINAATGQPTKIDVESLLNQLPAGAKVDLQFLSELEAKLAEQARKTATANLNQAVAAAEVQAEIQALQQPAIEARSRESEYQAGAYTRDYSGKELVSAALQEQLGDRVAEVLQKVETYHQAGTPSEVKDQMREDLKNENVHMTDSATIDGEDVGPLSANIVETTGLAKALLDSVAPEIVGNKVDPKTDLTPQQQMKAMIDRNGALATLQAFAEHDPTMAATLHTSMLNTGTGDAVRSMDEFLLIMHNTQPETYVPYEVGRDKDGNKIMSTFDKGDQTMAEITVGLVAKNLKVAMDFRLMHPEGHERSTFTMINTVEQALLEKEPDIKLMTQEEVITARATRGHVVDQAVAKELGQEAFAHRGDVARTFADRVRTSQVEARESGHSH